ncbi:hypothetical protein Nmul_A0031 [Nitrosospira multiformis ATCC 25196]|uniref:Uncharacterized protein n=1 Tax=Nitrosospira multiformis (strain ATCC 25196 / NCIMB 11849 / C 71) TaxID=323848 RepID=Q2YD31_NITMU|nr:hypothetical protein Nmul_A0031 [Nitrosospira multiformis ATCC 25196]
MHSSAEIAWDLRGYKRGTILQSGEISYGCPSFSFFKRHFRVWLSGRHVDQEIRKTKKYLDYTVLQHVLSIHLAQKSLEK